MARSEPGACCEASKPVLEKCILDCGKGRLIESRTPEELVDQFRHYHQVLLPDLLIGRYFRNPVERWRCPVCKLEWFTPPLLGEGDFYEFLGSFPWYYWEDSWDKRETVATLKQWGSGSILEVGSGQGHLLAMIKEAGLEACGVEINEAAIEHCHSRGLSVLHANSDDWRPLQPNTLVSLQCVEHVANPQETLIRYTSLPSVRRMIIAVPGTQTTLARSRDPLVWPPHHATLWSEQAIEKLASHLGFHVTDIRFQPQNWAGFNRLASLEPHRKLRGLPPWPTGIPGRLLYEMARVMGLSWATNAHTLLAMLERNTQS